MVIFWADQWHKPKESPQQHEAPFGKSLRCPHPPLEPCLLWNLLPKLLQNLLMDLPRYLLPNLLWMQLPRRSPTSALQPPSEKQLVFVLPLLRYIYIGAVFEVGCCKADIIAHTYIAMYTREFSLRLLQATGCSTRGRWASHWWHLRKMSLGFQTSENRNILFTKGMTNTYNFRRNILRGAVFWLRVLIHLSSNADPRRWQL